MIFVWSRAHKDSSQLNEETSLFKYLEEKKILHYKIYRTV